MEPVDTPYLLAFGAFAFSPQGHNADAPLQAQ
jgi:hypothetical protein